MNQTATPRTDALVAIINPMIDAPAFDNVTASYVRDALALARTLERENAQLRAALTTIHIEEGTGPTASVYQHALDVARAALAVQS